MPGEIEAVADKGYYKGEEIVACEQAGITVTVSKPHTSNAAAAGRFDRADFVYHSEQDAHLCPAGQRLAYHYTNKEAGKVLRNYWTNACQDCVVKHRCTTGSDASDAGEHEDILERVQKRLDDDARKIPLGAVAGVVGIEVGVVSGVFNLESSGVEAPDRRPRHEERYHEVRFSTDGS